MSTEDDKKSTGNSGQISEARARSLANLKPWKPGESGNVAGRPVRKPLTDALKRLGAMKPPDKVIDALRGQFPDVPREQWTWHLVSAAGQLRASVQKTEAFREVADRLEGKPLQSVNLRQSASDRDLTDEEIDREIAEGIERIRELEAKLEEEERISAPKPVDVDMAPATDLPSPASPSQPDSPVEPAQGPDSEPTETPKPK